MKRFPGAWTAILLFSGAGVAGGAETSRIRAQGSTTVGPVVSEAADHFRATKKWNVTVDTQGGSSAGVSAVAENLAEIGMISKDLTEADRKKYPGVDFVATRIGIDAVAVIVSEPVYKSGVTSLSLQQLRDIYEGKTTNWKQVGGPDAKIVFYNKEPGRGTWEVFANALYGKADRAPLVSHAEVGANQEARGKVANHPSAISQLSASWVEPSSKVRALALKLDDGRVVAPVAARIADGSYPMARHLALVTRGAPTGAAREFIDYLLAPDGQAFVAKHGYLRLADVGRSAAAVKAR